jgi:NADPH-dependent glutamate synthase beta subunit-like oxidoreductase
MSEVTLTIDSSQVTVPDTYTILQAAREAGIYIPTLCHHPDLPPGKGKKPAAAVYQGQRQIHNQMDRELEGCGLCVVEVQGQGEPMGSCITQVKDGMKVITDSTLLKKIRQEKLVPILARHPHACLACAQAVGCSRSQCSSNVPEEERCCPQFGHCELQDVVNYIGISGDTPRWAPTSAPVLEDEPLLVRDYNLCIGCTRCVRACEDYRGVGALGFVFDAEGRVQVGSLAQTLAESGCRFCTACVEVCPTGAIVDKKLPSGDKEEALVPCRAACPAGIDIPEYLRLVAAGQPEAALAAIREKVPLPGVLGRVCIHPCEEACRRGEVNQAVSICQLKRYASDQGGDSWKQRLETLPVTGKKVGIVGAGPAGLSAAFYLARKGHQVTIFEAEDKPGGMLRYGIPAYRLPQAVLDYEIAAIASLGVNIEASHKIESLSELKSLGFDALFLSVGAQLSRRIPLEGADQANVLRGLDFLRMVRQGQNPRVGPKVLVVGGGNVAVDVALSSLRQGAASVDMVCLERREEMPAHTWEVEGAEAEGVKVHNSWGPLKVGPEGKVDFRRCTRVFSDDGAFNPEYDDSQTTSFSADQVILAIGQASDLSLLEGAKVAVSRGLIQADSQTLATDEPGVFAGGDAMVMPGSVINAVAAARRAAAAMDEYLGGDGDIDFSLRDHTSPSPRLGKVEGFAALKRHEPAEREPGGRKADYGEICLGFSADEAQAEAGRCLQCQLRLLIQAVPSPPVHLLPFSEESLSGVPASEGVYTLFDQDYQVLAIKGAMDLKADLQQRLQDGSAAAFFEYEEDPMYSKAESERIQAYLQEHGSMPPGDGAGEDDMDDLF